MPALLQDLNSTSEVFDQIVQDLFLAEGVAVNITFCFVVGSAHFFDFREELLVGNWLRREVLIRRGKRIVHIQKVKLVIAYFFKHRLASVPKVTGVQDLAKWAGDVDHDGAWTVICVDEANLDFSVLAIYWHHLRRQRANLYPLLTFAGQKERLEVRKSKQHHPMRGGGAVDGTEVPVDVGCEVADSDASIQTLQVVFVHVAKNVDDRSPEHRQLHVLQFEEVVYLDVVVWLNNAILVSIVQHGGFCLGENLLLLHAR